MYGLSELNISTSKIPQNVYFVINRLFEAGYFAYIVGGGVRDLLIGETPNDFDIATDAKPEEIVKLFQNSRLIGRRFRLVHVFFKTGFLEVATFRKGLPFKKMKRNNKVIHRDNVFGTLHDDVSRRDFTINSMYLDVKANKILDFFGGLNDLEKKALRVIGQPKTRFLEDPCRLLRAVRFSKSYSLKYEGFNSKDMKTYCHEIRQIPPARLYSEIEKLFLRGVALEAFYELLEVGLIPYLFPSLRNLSIRNKKNPNIKMIRYALSSTDQRKKSGGSVTIAFLMAVFLWPSVRERLGNARGLDNRIISESLWLEKLLYVQDKYVSLPKKVVKVLCDIWDLQLVFENPSKRKAEKILLHPRLRAAYNFFFLRVRSGELPEKSLFFWRDFFQNSKNSKSLPFPKSISYKL